MPFRTALFTLLLSFPGIYAGAVLQAEKSGFTDQSGEEIRAEIREEMRCDGELQDQRRREGGSKAHLPARHS